jgi:hypothetical protein
MAGCWWSTGSRIYGSTSEIRLPACASSSCGELEAWSSGDPVTTEQTRIIIRRRRIRARVITRAVCMMIAQTASNTMPITASADVWLIPTL